jgi:L-ascorbate metabolism protein UlaG (beta-lactamase superfamily)
MQAQEKLHYWWDSAAYLQDQATLIFEQACKVLAAYPPATSIGDERKLALYSLDALLHDTRLDNSSALVSYVESVTGNIADELQKSKPSGSEIRFFRCYNDGFIIQTATVTIAIDLIRGGTDNQPFVNNSLMYTLVEQCDILFITHAHGDHTDSVVMELFLEQGKEVVVPENFRKESPPVLRVLRDTEPIRETIHLPAKNRSFSVYVYPGQQGAVPNNVYVITLPEGQTIMHTGDQDFSDDIGVKLTNAQVKVDVLLVQCWMMPMNEFVRGVNPALIICGHENEMGHTIDHREAYWLTFRRMSEVKVPYVVMAWGEWYTCFPF